MSDREDIARRHGPPADVADSLAGSTPAEWEADAAALAEGGPDEEWNLAPIHAEPCHREKTASESRRAKR